MCVRERVLSSDGKEEVILLDERYTPYDCQRARIENLCGSFTEFVSSAGLECVLGRQAGQRELYHLHGNVVLNQGRAAFLAVRGIDGLEGLARALRIHSASNVVHMVVLTSKIGKRAQVSSAGLLETLLHQQRGHVRVVGRIYEQTNSVGFSLTRSAAARHAVFLSGLTPFLFRFERLPFFMPVQFRPDSNDWTVTGKGMVIIRLIWKSMAWSREAEEACLGLCNGVTDWLQAHC